MRRRRRRRDYGHLAARAAAIPRDRQADKDRTWLQTADRRDFSHPLQRLYIRSNNERLPFLERFVQPADVQQPASRQGQYTVRARMYRHAP